MKQNVLWINKLDQLIEQKHMLKSTFYQAWTAGKLTRDILQEYAKEYYQHIKAFPTYISALHSRCDDPKIRSFLLTNLMDEEVGKPNHLDLWRSFTLSLGVTEEDLDNYKPKTVTQELIEQFRRICNSQSLVAGLAALYTYESQIPTLCRTKIDGLQKWYGVTDRMSYHYFTVHETADVEHSEVEKQIIMNLITEEDEESALEGADKILDSLNNFLDSFCTTYAA